MIDYKIVRFGRLLIQFKKPFEKTLPNVSCLIFRYFVINKVINVNSSGLSRKVEMFKNTYIHCQFIYTVLY